MEAPTPFLVNKPLNEDSSNKKKEDIKYFDINLNNKKYKLQLSKSNKDNNNQIIIKISEEKSLIEKYYLVNMNLDEFYNLNIIFKLYNSIEEIYTCLLNALNEKRFKASLNNQYIILTFNFLLPGNKIIDINFTLVEIKQKKEDLIEQLYLIVNQLSEENKSIKETLKNLICKQDIMQNEINNKNNEINNIKEELNKVKNENFLILQNYKNFEQLINDTIKNEFQDLNKSHILKDDKEKNLLYSWISSKGAIKKIKLLYRASENSSNKSFFHKCSNKGTTVSIIKTKKGRRFGGFTKANWTDKKGVIYLRDEDAFLFSLDKNKIYNILNPDFAVSCHPSCYSLVYGNHGDGGGLCIDNDKNALSYENQFSKVYDVPSNYCLSEEKEFYIEECEVYQIS